MLYYITQDVPIQGGIITIDSKQVTITDYVEEYNGHKFDNLWIKGKDVNGYLIDRMIYRNCLWTDKLAALKDAEERKQQRLKNLLDDIARARHSYDRLEAMSFTID